MQAGTLTTLRFVKGTPDPFYDMLTRQIILQLPTSNQDPIAVNELDAIITHETTHSLIRQAFEDTQYSLNSPEAKTLVSACNTIRQDILQNTQYLISNMPGVYAAAEAQARPANKALIARFAKAIADYDPLAKKIVNPYQYKNNGYAETNDNLCEDGDDGALGDLIDAVATKKEREAGYSDIFSLPAFQPIINKAADAAEYSSIYKQLNESNFVQSSSNELQQEGHSEDNVNELVATFIDVTMNYPKQVGAMIATMMAEDQNAALHAIWAAQKVVTDLHPNLRPLFQNSHKQLMAAIAAN